MINKTLTIVLGVFVASMNVAWAESSDMQNQEKALIAREKIKMGDMDHGGDHGEAATTAGKYRGVFYGYLPCEEPDCDGIKMTLSLNPKNRYLLVIQPAKRSNRESFEKGKYDWDDKNRTVVLTPKNGEPQRRLAIQDDGVLKYLSADGTALPGKADRYLLERSDKSDKREMHIH